MQEILILKKKSWIENFGNENLIGILTWIQNLDNRVLPKLN